MLLAVTEYPDVVTVAPHGVCVTVTFSPLGQVHVTFQVLMAMEPVLVTVKLAVNPLLQTCSCRDAEQVGPAGLGVTTGVGEAVGTGVGEAVGTGVGTGVGEAVGTGVGGAVGKGVGVTGVFPFA